MEYAAYLMMLAKRVQWLPLFGLFVWIVVGLIAAGAALGAAVFPLCGWALGMADVSYGQMAASGARTLGFYIGVVWGPGIAVVACVIRLKRYCREG